MLTLYYKPTCPFCQKVLGEAEAKGWKFNLKDITSDPAIADELIERGGKRQVPYLVDADTSTEMYESDDIIAYLSEKYPEGNGGASFGGVKIHKSDGGACEVCE